MNYYYGIGKMPLDKKLFGVYKNHPIVEYDPLLRGLNDNFKVPHSRYTAIDEKTVKEDSRLVVLAEGEDCGISVAKSIDGKKFFFFGHSEYDRETLKKEYLRDKDKGMDIDIPEYYFVDGDMDKINMGWKSTGHLLFNNWLNYYVYQVTPYDIGR